MAYWLRIVFLGMIGSVSMPVHAVSTATSSFYLDWSGIEHNNQAEAHGWLTVYSEAGSKFTNTAENVWLLPFDDVVDFSVTVSGAGSGNGTFRLSDFEFFMWSTKAAGVWPDDTPQELMAYTATGLDLSLELVGQATSGGPWGSNHSADALGGDFNLFADFGLNPFAPNSNGAAFQIATNGGAGDVLNLVSFRPVPIPAAFWLFGSALLGVANFSFKRQARARQ